MTDSCFAVILAAVVIIFGFIVAAENLQFVQLH